MDYSLWLYHKGMHYCTHFSIEALNHIITGFE
jgi:hypothetical protein